MKKTVLFFMCFLFFTGCLCNRNHPGYGNAGNENTVTSTGVQPSGSSTSSAQGASTQAAESKTSTETTSASTAGQTTTGQNGASGGESTGVGTTAGTSVGAAQQSDMTSMSEVSKMMEDKGFKDSDGYETNLDTVKSELKDGDSAVILVNGDHYIGITKEKGNKYLVQDADINNGKKVEYSEEEFNKIMNGEAGRGTDKKSGKGVVNPAGYSVNSEHVDAVTNAEGIAQSVQSRKLSGYEMDNTKGSGAKAVIPVSAGKGSGVVAASIGANPAVHFAFDSSKLTEEDKDTIRGLAEGLKGKNYNVTIQGHTDWIGTREYNQKLSVRRAKAVKAELVKDGLDATKIEVKGYGKDRPIADNKTAAGRAKNRRAVMFAEVGE